MNEQNFPQPNEPVQSLKNIWTTIIAIVLTAILVGSGVYWWQKLTSQREIEKIQQQIVSLDRQSQLLQQENEKLSEQIVKLTVQDNNVEKISDESALNTGWKNFNSSGRFVYSTEDWSSYLSTNDNFSFSIEYPGDWTLSGSVFSDINGNKIAEFLPGLVVLQTSQKCFDVNEEENTRSRLISKTNISIGGKTGMLEIYETGTERGIWYPNIYCLSEGNKAFVMSFYEHDLGTGDIELFEKILTTLKFE